MCLVASSFVCSYWHYKTCVTAVWGERYPQEFIDPILQTVMNDPVVLPGSGQVVDRETIKRHLLCDGTDPFSRSPLTESMLRPAVDLRTRIEAWRENAPEPAAADDAAGK